MELKFSELIEPEYNPRKLLIAPLMELKFKCLNKTINFFVTFNRTAYGIEI